MALNKKQKKFIKKKVKKLGSIKKVKMFYNQQCVVDDFANEYVKKLFKLKRRKKIGEKKESREKAG